MGTASMPKTNPPNAPGAPDFSGFSGGCGGAIVWTSLTLAVPQSGQNFHLDSSPAPHVEQ